VAILRAIMEVLVSAFAPIIKEVILESFKNTVEESSPDVALRERLFRRVRDANDSSS